MESRSETGIPALSRPRCAPIFTKRLKSPNSANLGQIVGVLFWPLRACASGLLIRHLRAARAVRSHKYREASLAQPTRRTTAMAAERAQNLQDTFLNHVRKAKIPLTIFLVNGVKLQGVVTWFDNFCVLLRRDGHSQLVYKHAISTIMPGHPVQLFESEDAPAAMDKV